MNVPRSSRARSEIGNRHARPLPRAIDTPHGRVPGSVTRRPERSGADADTDADPMVYDVQTGVYAENTVVELANLVVTSPDAGYGFFVQDETGTEYSGIWVYYGDVDEFEPAVSLGDQVTISGEYIEYNEFQKPKLKEEFTLQQQQLQFFQKLRKLI